MISNEQLLAAHRFSANNRLALKKDRICGCFHCLKIFPPDEIGAYIEGGDSDRQGTAVCPYCGIDSVIGEGSGFPITEDFLRKMKEYWFAGNNNPKKEKSMKTTDKLITDFTDPEFAAMFRRYFSEFGIHVKDWDGLLREMNGGENCAYIRLDESGNPIGFIQFTPITLSNWFFEAKIGFIREFWVDGACRGQGHGSALLRLAEAYFLECGISKTVLTTDSAEVFYIRRGYKRADEMTAKNQDPVFVKNLLSADQEKG